jgi:hypothetical protein
MKPFEKFPQDLKKKIGYVLADIDDTLTLNGRLPAVVFAAMERLKTAGIRIIPITGRPAGWWAKTAPFTSGMMTVSAKCSGAILKPKTSARQTVKSWKISNWRF